MATADQETNEFRAGLNAALEDALHDLRSSTEPVGLLFSGGVDSSLLAWELRLRPNVLLCTLGNEGAPDHRSGRDAAKHLGLPWQSLPVSKDAVHAARARFEEELGGVPPVSQTVLLSLSLAIAAAPPGQLVCGQGVDELFLGYAHYGGLTTSEAERRSHEDLERLLRTDWPRTHRIAEKAGKQILAPYLSRSFIDHALRIPIDVRLPRESTKGFFREWAVGRGLPPELAFRPKKALQYGSGVAALVRRWDRGSP